MDDLISRKALLEQLEPEYMRKARMVENGEYHLDTLAEGFTSAHSLIENAPAVEAVPVTDLKEFAQDVAYQFGCYCEGSEPLRLSHMGLSTLEWAFDILGWENYHLVPECECQIEGCHKHATCGATTTDGYKWMCGRHMREKTAPVAEIDFDYEAED